MNIIKKILYKVIIYLGITILIIVMGFFAIKNPFISEHPFVKIFMGSSPAIYFTPSQLHFYDDPKISLANVHVQAFYLVPHKFSGVFHIKWKEDFTGALEEMKEFYENQFGDSLKLTFSLLDTPVVATDEFIESLPVGFTRPTLVNLEPVDKFIEDNITKPGAPFYRKQFTEVPNNAYTVKVIFVEGPAAAGSERLLLLSRNFITDESIDYGTTVLAHEFGHTLGMPDLYDYETGEAFSDDIMGSGRWRAINYNYIGEDIKNKMLEK